MSAHDEHTITVQLTSSEVAAIVAALDYIVTKAPTTTIWTIAGREYLDVVARRLSREFFHIVGIGGEV